MDGYYIEAAYDFMPLINKNSNKNLSLFSRYEAYNTHAATAGDLEKNKAFDRTDITFGCDFKIAPGVAVKADYQWRTDAQDGSDRSNLFNAGVGVMF